MIREEVLEAFAVHASDDPAKRDRELVCGTCGQTVCDVEAGDNLLILAQTTQDHYDNYCSGN